MMVPEMLFYLFAALAVVSAIGVVSVRNTVYSVLFLVLTFVSTAVIWLLLETEFLALVLVLVYVGAVMTLFLFVVMMLNLRKSSLDEGLVKRWPLAVLVLLIVTGLMVAATRYGKAGLAIPGEVLRPYSSGYSNVSDLGSVLYTTWVWPFEIAAVLLLSAIVAAIALAHRRGARNSLRQDPVLQGNVRVRDRVRLVKNMKPEKKS